MQTLSLSLLGPFRIVGERSRFDSAKVRALLAFLALESARPHSREALAGLLWPDQPERAARHSLNQASSNLRQVLGEQGDGPRCLETSRATLRFRADGPCTVDVLVVEGLLAGCELHAPRPEAGCASCACSLARGVEQIGGPLLEGFSLADAAPFEEWAQQRRERLFRQQLDALHTLGEHALLQGDVELARGYARQQLELDLLHEPAQRQLMLALARSGLRAAALRQYHECARVLEAELGVGPADETRRLYEQIKGHSLDPAPAEAAPQLSARPQHPAPPSAPPSLFVGRAAELARLEQALAPALHGRGQVIFVTGETGSGKTALLREFARRAVFADERVVVAGGSCTAQSGRGDPYLPFRELLGALTGELEEGRGPCPTPPEERARLRAMAVDATEALVCRGPALVDTLVPGYALLARAAALVAERNHGSAAAGWLGRLEQLAGRRSLPPLEQLGLFEQLAAVLTTLAARRPLILLLDDLQWADAGSADLLFHLGRAVANSPLLIVAAYRPEELAAGRDGARHPLAQVVNELRRIFGHQAVALDGADQAAARHFVDALLDAEPNVLGPSFREALLRQTGGHPLFTVELLRDMQARGDLVRDQVGRWAAGPTLNWEALPARVEGAIAERVERLDEAERELLLVAAVEGERFTAEVVARVQSAEHRVTVRSLSGELDRRHRLVCGQGTRLVGEQQLALYSFRHILFQRYLYGQLDPVERAYLHAEVAAALEALHGDASDAIAAQLAHHYERAGNPARAIQYLRCAGERAIAIAAFEDAIGLLGRALALIAALPPGSERDQLELTLQVARAVPLAGTRGYAHPEVERSYARARALCHTADPSPELFAALWGLCSYYLVRAEGQPLRELSAQLSRLARTTPDPVLHTVGHWAVGVTALYSGDLAGAQAQLDQMAGYATQAGEAAAALFATDPGVACHCWASWALWLGGRPDQALGRSEAALALAERIDHPFSQVYALFTGTALLQFRREPQQALAWAEATIRLAARHGFAFFHGLGTVFRGWALAEQGCSEEGLRLMEAGLEAARATGARIGMPHMLALLAEAHGRRGDSAQALALVDEALALAHSSGERHYEAELHRLRGILLLAAPAADPSDTPEASLRRAVALARTQGAASLELRACVALCRLLVATGRPDEGRVALLACYARFAEGFQTTDLREALALLAKLNPVIAA